MGISMIILGISGSSKFPLDESDQDISFLAKRHDSAVALLKDGNLVYASEEERCNRIKHYGKTPLLSISKCLNYCHINIEDIDKIVVDCRENEVDVLLTNEYIFKRSDVKSGRDWVKKVIKHLYNYDYPEERIEFVEHHYCHAANAYYMSGYDSSLILTVDGASPEGYAGYLMSASGDSFEVLDKITNADSLGAFYTRIIMFLGYFQHDEYKVMGLAPYGNPNKYKGILKKIYTLLPDGKYKINTEYYGLLYDYIDIRRKGEPFTQDHKDLAAALQESLETIILHILSYFKEKTKHTRLCLSGGVAHNCSMNGKILHSGLFKEVYVQPAAHDAGNAIGSVLYVAKKANEEIKAINHLYLGTDICSDESLEHILNKWDSFIKYNKKTDIIESAAELLTDGQVIGWVQGRTEFGPRALGNRSILADPRPEKNRLIINEMVKKRESYRPFAPSILIEHLEEFYEVPEAKTNLSFMNFVLHTKEEKRAVLGAVTHIDGSARIQTVTKETNEKYWNLIACFKKKTGIPILLNTSFNNNVEPIIDSEYDALVCFMTTSLNYMVIGDYLIEKKSYTYDSYMEMVLERPIISELKEINSKEGVRYELNLVDGKKYKKSVSAGLFKLLELSNGIKTIKELLFDLSLKEEQQVKDIVDEILQLWEKRVLKLNCR